MKPLNSKITNQNVARLPNSDDSTGVAMRERRSTKEPENLQDLEALSVISGNYAYELKPLLSGNKNSTVTENAVNGNGNQDNRLYSLDVFRGITVAAMILVDYCGAFWSGLSHSPWNGITFADFVVPAFLFMVGFSLSLAYKKLDDRQIAIMRMILRALKIFSLGLLLQGGYLHGVKDLSYGVDLRFLRIMGVLQRIAIAYVIAALCEICRTKQHAADADESLTGILKIYKWHWMIALVLLVLYTGLLYGVYVPDWSFTIPLDANTLHSNATSLLVKCEVRGSTSPGCNAVGFLDRLILGITHLYKRPTYRRLTECNLTKQISTAPLSDDVPSWCLAPFDPEGLLSSLPAVVTCLIGAHYGHILLHIKDQKTRLLQWITSGSLMLSVGMLLECTGMPLNKQLYTLSYMFVTGGVVAVAFSATYVMVDIYKWRYSAAPLKWIGEHSLIIYALLASDVLPIAIQGVYWKSPNNNIIQMILRSMGF